MPVIYQYTKIITQGPNGTTVGFKQTDGAESQPLELCTIDDVTYISVPDGYVIEEQPSEIGFTQTVLTDALMESIKANSRAIQLITERVQCRIREKYSLEDEQYFARIGVGASLGVYTFLPGEQDTLVAFGNYVEECRQYGKTQRAEFGL